MKNDYLFFDTENDDKGNVTLIASVHVHYDNLESGNWKKRKEEKLFTSRYGFVQYLDNFKVPIIGYAHNLEYDLVNVFKNYYPNIDQHYLKSQLIFARYGKFTFYDTTKHFPMPLAMLGDIIGLKKGKLDIHSKDYVLNDVRIIEKAMTYFMETLFDKYGITTGATAGGSAIKVWKSITDSTFIGGHYEPPLSREAYYGGRCEIFRREHKATSQKDLVHYYDINSMYPYVMTFRYPEQLGEDPKMEKDYGLVDAEFEIPKDDFISLIPYRYKKRLCYPVGRFRSVCTYHEARQKGVKIVKIHSSQGTNLFSTPFRNYVMELYEMRMNARNEAEKLCYKILLNSLYGKMAQRNQSQRTVDKVTLSEYIQKHPKQAAVYLEVGEGRFIMEYSRRPDSFVNVVWGAYITSYARIQLNQILIANKERVMYCDTDSCHVIGEGIAGVKVGKRMGEVKLEKTEPYAKYILPKLYQSGANYTAKGVPAAYDPETGTRDMKHRKDFFEGRTAKFMKPYRFRESVRRTSAKVNVGQTEMFAPNLWAEREKTVSSTYYKPLRGNEYYPICLPRDQQRLIDTSRRSDAQQVMLPFS